MSINNLLIAMAFSMLFPLYKILSEWRFGDTIGKKANRIKIVSVDNNKITFVQALKRNIYLILFFLIPYLVLIIFYDQLFDFHEPSGENGLYIGILERGIGAFEMFIVLVFLIIAFLIYAIIWLVIIIVSTSHAVDHEKKQTFFDVFSKTVSIKLKE